LLLVALKPLTQLRKTQAINNLRNLKCDIRPLWFN